MYLILCSVWMSCALLLVQTKAQIQVAGEGPANAETACDGAVRKLIVGYKSLELSSPDYPDLYPNETTCLWRITTMAGSRINLTALSMNIESIPSCSFDYIKIIDGGVETAPVLGTFCGDQLFSVVTSSHNALVVFHSDISYSGLGFRLEYTQTNSSARGPEARTLGERNDCNTTRRVGPGYILSPGYPLPYPSDLWCQYTIHAPKGKTVEIEFRDFALEWNDECDADNLTIVQQDGSQQSFCGRTIPARIRSQGTQLTLIFHSDSLLSFRGFNVSYIFVATKKPNLQDDNGRFLSGGDPDCSAIHTVGPGVVSSPLHPHTYPRLKSCITVIQAPKEHTVILDFTSFILEETLECESDFLTLHDGVTADSAMLGKYCGREIANSTVKSSSSGLRLQFHSDYSVQESGFKANYRFVSAADDDNYECDGDCLNGGECRKDQDGEFYCECSLNYIGDTCSDLILTCNQSPCKNGATCETNILGYHCICPEKYIGTHCESLEQLMFTQTSGNRTVEEGDEVILQCDLNFELEIIWIFEDSTFFTDGGAVAKSFGVIPHRLGVLEIKHFTDSNSGKYSCYATDRRTEIRADFWVIMDKPCNLVYTQEPSNHTSLEGKSHMFTCEVKNKQSIEWLKDDITVTPTDRIKILVNNYLHISEINLSDAGRYTCVSRGDGGCVRRRTAWLDVRHKSGVDKVCGKPRIGRIRQRGRITKGSVAPEGAHPWFALLVNSENGNEAPGFCGGSLIDKRWVVTAAHCLVTTVKGRRMFNTNITRVHLGSTDCTGIGGITRSVVNVILHKGFDKKTFDNDIALLKLSQDVAYDRMVLPICLQPEGVINAQFINKKQAGFVIGCGAEIYGGISSQKLMQVKVPLRSRAECEESTKNSFTKNMICAGYTRATQGDSCQGDSGGPLAMTFQDRSVLVGVVSWGDECDKDGSYGYYTNVGVHYDWINEKIALDEMESEEEKA